MSDAERLSDAEQPHAKAEEEPADQSTSDVVDVKEAEQEETEEEDVSAGNISHMKTSESEPAVEEWNQIDVVNKLTVYCT